MFFYTDKKENKYRRSLVIYDFAPDPSKFPNIWGNFYFLYISLFYSGITFSGTRRPGFSGRICCFWPGFSGRSLSGMGNLKKLYGQQGKLFWYLQRDFLSLIREFSGGKLKQKGFFHSVSRHQPRKISLKIGSDFFLHCPWIQSDICLYRIRFRSKIYRHMVYKSIVYIYCLAIFLTIE
jgi:hypothetical protein